MSAATSSSNGPDASFENILKTRLPDLLPDHPRIVAVSPVAAPGGHHPNIRRILLDTGDRLVAKRNLFAAFAGHTTAQPPHEASVSEFLLAHGCRVPTVVCSIPETGITVYQDVGTETLDDLVQTSPPDIRARVGRHVVDGFLQLQRRFVDQDIVPTWLAPGTDEQTVRHAFLEITATLALEVLKPLLRSPGDRQNVVDRIHALVETLAGLSMFIGPTDYNARNIVLSEKQEPSFLETSKLGYDWPERRLVQYATSLGSGRTGASPRSLIDGVEVGRYAEGVTWRSPEEAAFALDGHHLLFHLLIGAHWTRHGERPPRSVRRALSTPLTESKKLKEIRQVF